MPESLPPQAGERSDAVFKTFVEAALLLALSVAQLIVGFPFGAFLLMTAILVAASLAGDAYLFGSIGRAFAARRSLRFKSSPFLAAAAVLIFLLPRESEGDKLLLFTLAAGIGGVFTALLNRGGGSTASA